MGFKTLVVLLMRGFKTSLQRELDRFYKSVEDSDFNIRAVTKSALTKARAKLNPSAFVELSEVVANTFYRTIDYKKWKKWRLIAADGSRLRLPRHQSVIEEFGQHGFGQHADAQRSLAVCSLLYDPLNQITLNAQLRPLTTGENAILAEQLRFLSRGDLLLLDRGYPTHALFFELTALGIDFCARMKEDWWLVVKAFQESGKTDDIVTLELPKKDHSLLEKYPKLKEKLRVRLISVDLDNGDKEILCTSLVNRRTCDTKDFYELYHHRWGIEEAYKLLKARIDVENFSGKTARAVRQDFFAKIFLMNLCAYLGYPIEEKVRAEWNAEQNKRQQKINRTSAIEMTRSISIALFLKRTHQKAIAAFDILIKKTLEIVRPRRKNPRVKKTKQVHYMNYKSW